METLITALVQNVDTKLVKNGTMTIWEVATPEGKFSTTKPEYGNAARELIGKVADMKVSIQQNGQYTNRYLNAIRLSRQSVDTPVGQAALRAQEAQQVTYEQYRSGEAEKDSQRTESIHRQCAAKVAAAMSTDAVEFWANVDAVFTFFQTGNYPTWAQAAQAPEAKQGVTSHTSPSDGDHGWGDAPQDDIPFNRTIDGFGN